MSTDQTSTLQLSHRTARPCPRCGAPTLADYSVCPTCGTALNGMEHRRWMRSLLALGYGALAIVVLYYGAVIFFLSFVLYLLAGQASWPDQLLEKAILYLLGLTLTIAVLIGAAIGILRGRRAAYVLHVVLLICAIPLPLTPLVFPAAAEFVLFWVGNPHEQAAQVAAVNTVVLRSLGVLAVAVVLTAFSYTDFFGRRVG